MTSCNLDTSVPDLVIEHPEALAMCQELGIDYSCGWKSLAYACHERGVDVEMVLTKLLRSLDNNQECVSTKEWDMAVPHAQPGEVIDVRPLGSGLAKAKTCTLLKTEKIEIIRLVMAAGKVLAEHKAPGEIIVHCIEGRIAFTALGQTHELTAGHLVSLPAGEPHSVQCLEDASFLLTILLRSSPAP